MVLLAGLGWPAGSRAGAPTVFDFATTQPFSGYGMYPINFTFNTAWTGSVLSLTYSVASNPAAGPVVTYSGGLASYFEPTNSAFIGTDSCTWYATTSTGETSMLANCWITISNDVPRGADFTWSGQRQDLPNSLANLNQLTTHADYGQPMSYAITSPPTNGSASINPNNQLFTLSYTPNADFVLGTDTLYWTVSDGVSTSAPALLTICFTTNHVPVASPVSCTVTSGVLSAPLFDPSAMYTHADCGQTMTYLVTTPASHGTACIEAASGAIDYTSAPMFIGTDTFQWAVCDGYATSTPAVVTVTVLPNAPVTFPQTVVAAKNSALMILPAYSGGGGYICKPVIIFAPTHGSAVATNGMHICYTPATNYLGTDSFTWKIAYSNASSPVMSSATVSCSVVVKDVSTNADWTQWRFDEARSAQTAMTLPDQLYLQWRRDLPTCPNSFAGCENLFYDKNNKLVGADMDNCRPVQLGKTLFVSCMANDSVSAYDTDTGAQKWRYYAGGALRRPPVAVALPNGTNVVIFGSDDGVMYCLNAMDGAEYWKFQAAPKVRRAMGYGRLSSVWPIWASPVVCSNKVYFAAGHIPTWGIWVYCLDAASGAVIWCNDGRLLQTGSNNSHYSTMGPLAFSTDHSKLYGTSAGGMSTSWTLSPTTGELTGYGSASVNSKFGGANWWFVDGSGIPLQCEPVRLVAGGRSFTNTDMAAMGVAGTVCSMLAGDGKLFVATKEGGVYCFGGAQATPTIYPNTVTPLPSTNDTWVSVVQNMLTNRADLAQGLALVWGVGSGRLVEELAKQGTNLMVVAVDPDTNKLMRLRREMDAAGWSGARVSTVQGNPMECGFAPYQAVLIASEDVGAAGYANGAAMVQMLYKCTRPFGGEIWLATSNAQHAAIAGWLTAATNLVLHDAVPSYDVHQRTEFTGLGADGFTQIRRLGLPDANLALKPPFRMIAFGSISSGVNAAPNANYPQRGLKDGFGLDGRPSTFDLYSWLPEKSAMTGYEPAAPACNNTTAGSAYIDSGKPNLLYARTERGQETFGPSTPSCSGVNHYGTYIMEAGKVGYIQDTNNYNGVLIMSEMSGCQGDYAFAGNGVAVFAASDFCCCNRGMCKTQMGVVPSDDPGEEYWVNYQLSRSVKKIQETPMRRVGINFGAPGDRYDDADQMLWTHHPSFGVVAKYLLADALPLLPVRYRGGNVKSWYHRSEQMLQTNNPSHGWVAASYVSGMSGLTIPLASPLVAYRTTTPPTLDGVLNDSCWTNQMGVEMPIDLRQLKGALGPQDVTSAGYVKLCYDDTNLYIAAGIRASVVPSQCFLEVVLNSRDQRVTPVMLWHYGAAKSSQGIATGAWQVMATTNNNPTTYQTVYQEEVVIPWSALAAAGLWKEQLVMNLVISQSLLNGQAANSGALGTSGSPFFDTGGNNELGKYLSPVYLDAPRGAVTNASPYTVRLYFAEMEGVTNGQRTCDVQLQGHTVLTNFDVVAQAGGPKRELRKEFCNVAIADHLDIDFANTNNAPMLSGVEIIDTQTNASGAHIDPPNVPPVAILTASSTNGPAPLDVSFSAQSSYDPDGQIVECAWETGDGRLARGSLLHHIFAEPGTYTVNLLVLDNRGGTGVTNMQVVVSAGVPSAFVCNIRSNGLSGCDYTTLTAWNTALKSDLTSTQSLLFTVSGLGSYVTNDDGSAVTFTGNCTGALKHINASGIAYVTGCSGAIQPGPVTCGLHTFTISDTGHRIVTAVAQCYNDWPKGLVEAPTITGWTADENHGVTVRAAAGQGHTGKLKNASGYYTGFTIKGNLNVSAIPYMRIEKIADDGGNLTLGKTNAANRVLFVGNVVAGANSATIANSIATSFSVNAAYSDISYYNCTAKTYSLRDWNYSGIRAVNCLAWVTNSTAISFYPYDNAAQKLMYWVSHCVSADATATNCDTWQDGNEGNLANKTVTFVNAATNDFHLATTDTGARAMGVPGLGADIDGDARTGPLYDIGADQSAPANHAPQLLSGPNALPNPVATNAVVQFTFSANDIDGNVLTNYWIFGDGSTGSPQAAFVTNHIYNSIGTYTAQVAISDGTLATTGSVVVSVISGFAAWQIQQFGSTNAPGSGPTDDPDHDGLNNLQEYLAGTNPNDASSVLKCVGAQSVPDAGGVSNKMVLVWSSQSNRWYAIDYSSNLMSGFSPAVSNIPANYPQNTYTEDVGSAASGFFKIRLQP